MPPIGPAAEQYAPPLALSNFGRQGNFTYYPVVVFLSDTSLSGLQSQLTSEIGAQSVQPKRFWVLKDIQYQAVQQPGGMEYSVCIHAEVAERP